LNVFDELQDGQRRFGEELGATLWGGTVYELAPGSVSDYHWQYGEEEWLVVVSGEPTLRTPESKRRLRPWDAAVFRRGPDGAHQLRNDTDAPARFLMMSSISDPEVSVYPDQGQTGIIAGWSGPGLPVTRGWVQPP
jgi:uncharacterized cupin superfamily protein